MGKTQKRWWISCQKKEAKEMMGIKRVLIIVYILTLIGFLETIAILKGIDGKMFASAMSTMSFIAGLILPSPLKEK